MLHQIIESNTKVSNGSNTYWELLDSVFGGSGDDNEKGGGDSYWEFLDSNSTKTTVLGSRDDLYKFLGDPKYNVLDPNKDVTFEENMQFIRDSAASGDDFMFKKDPVKWNNFTTKYANTSSRLLDEYRELQNLGVDESRINL